MYVTPGRGTTLHRVTTALPPEVAISPNDGVPQETSGHKALSPVIGLYM